MVAIGIDLGTTYSCVGVFQNGKVEIIATTVIVQLLHTLLLHPKSDLSGGSQNQAAEPHYVFDVKRLIGRNISDPVIQNDLKTISCYWKRWQVFY